VQLHQHLIAPQFASAQVEPERAEADLLIIHRIRHSRETADLRPLNKDLKSAPALMSSIEISVSVTH
jgi:hypothetical protein